MSASGHLFISLLCFVCLFVEENLEVSADFPLYRTDVFTPF